MSHTNILEDSSGDDPEWNRLAESLISSIMTSILTMHKSSCKNGSKLEIALNKLLEVFSKDASGHLTNITEYVHHLPDNKKNINVTNKKSEGDYRICSSSYRVRSDWDDKSVDQQTDSFEDDESLNSETKNDVPARMYSSRKYDASTQTDEFPRVGQLETIIEGEGPEARKVYEDQKSETSEESMRRAVQHLSSDNLSYESNRVSLSDTSSEIEEQHRSRTASLASLTNGNVEGSQSTVSNRSSSGSIQSEKHKWPSSKTPLSKNILFKPCPAKQFALSNIEEQSDSDSLPTKSITVSPDKRPTVSRSSSSTELKQNSSHDSSDKVSEASRESILPSFKDQGIDPTMVDKASGGPRQSRIPKSAKRMSLSSRSKSELSSSEQLLNASSVHGEHLNKQKRRTDSDIKKEMRLNAKSSKKSETAADKEETMSPRSSDSLETAASSVHGDHLDKQKERTGRDNKKEMLLNAKSSKKSETATDKEETMSPRSFESLETAASSVHGDHLDMQKGRTDNDIKKEMPLNAKSAKSETANFKEETMSPRSSDSLKTADRCPSEVILKIRIDSFHIKQERMCERRDSSSPERSIALKKGEPEEEAKGAVLVTLKSRKDSKKRSKENLKESEKESKRMKKKHPRSSSLSSRDQNVNDTYTSLKQYKDVDSQSEGVAVKNKKLQVLPKQVSQKTGSSSRTSTDSVSTVLKKSERPTTAPFTPRKKEPESGSSKISEPYESRISPRSKSASEKDRARVLKSTPSVQGAGSNWSIKLLGAESSRPKSAPKTCTPFYDGCGKDSPVCKPTVVPNKTMERKSISSITAKIISEPQGTIQIHTCKWDSLAPVEKVSCKPTCQNKPQTASGARIGQSSSPPLYNVFLTKPKEPLEYVTEPKGFPYLQNFDPKLKTCTYPNCTRKIKELSEVPFSNKTKASSSTDKCYKPFNYFTKKSTNPPNQCAHKSCIDRNFREKLNVPTFVVGVPHCKCQQQSVFLVQDTTSGKMGEFFDPSAFNSNNSKAILPEMRTGSAHCTADMLREEASCRTRNCSSANKTHRKSQQRICNDSDSDSSAENMTLKQSPRHKPKTKTKKGSAKARSITSTSSTKSKSGNVKKSTLAKCNRSYDAVKNISQISSLCALSKQNIKLSENSLINAGLRNLLERSDIDTSEFSKEKIADFNFSLLQDIRQYHSVIRDVLKTPPYSELPPLNQLSHSTSRFSVFQTQTEVPRVPSRNKKIQSTVAFADKGVSVEASRKKVLVDKGVSMDDCPIIKDDLQKCDSKINAWFKKLSKTESTIGVLREKISNLNTILKQSDEDYKNLLFIRPNSVENCIPLEQHSMDSELLRTQSSQSQIRTKQERSPCSGISGQHSGNLSRSSLSGTHGSQVRQSTVTAAALACGGIPSDTSVPLPMPRQAIPIKPSYLKDGEPYKTRKSPKTPR